MLAALGLFVFEMDALPFAEIQRREDWRHARAPRVGERDAVQFVGPGDDRVTIVGCLIPGVTGTFAAIETLRDMAASGEPCAFLDGTGQVWGNYTIDNLDRRSGFLMLDGIPRKVDFAIELSRVD